MQILDPVKDESLNGKVATLLGGSWNIADLEKSNLNWGGHFQPMTVRPHHRTGDWLQCYYKRFSNLMLQEKPYSGNEQ